MSINQTEAIYKQVNDAWSSLECALAQSIPSDDQMIMARVREAAATLAALQRSLKDGR